MTVPLISHGCGLQRVQATSGIGQLDLFDTGSDGRLERAIAEDRKGRASVARKLYWEAIDARDRVADAFCNLAVISYELGDEAGAREYLADALTNVPDHALAHYNSGTLALFQGNNSVAVLHYREGEAAEPNLPCLQLNLGVALARSGDYGGAMAVLERLAVGSGSRADEARKLLVAVTGLRATQLPLQDEVRRLIGSLEQAKQRVNLEEGQGPGRSSSVLRSKEYRSIVTAIEALQKVVPERGRQVADQSRRSRL